MVSILGKSSLGRGAKTPETLLEPVLEVEESAGSPRSDRFEASSSQASNLAGTPRRQAEAFVPNGASFWHLTHSPPASPPPLRPGLRRMRSCPPPTIPLPAVPSLRTPPCTQVGPLEGTGGSRGNGSPWSLPPTPADEDRQHFPPGALAQVDEKLAHWLHVADSADELEEERAWRAARASLRDREGLLGHFAGLVSWLLQRHQRLQHAARPRWAFAQWAQHAPALLCALCTCAEGTASADDPAPVHSLRALKINCCGLPALLGAPATEAPAQASRLLLALAKYDGMVPLYLANVVRHLAEQNESDNLLVKLSETLAARGLKGSTTALGLAFAVIDNTLSPIVRAAREPFGPRAARAASVWSLLKLEALLSGPTGVLLVHGRCAAILRERPEWANYGRQQLRRKTVRNAHEAELAVQQAQYGAWVAEALRSTRPDRAVDIACQADEALRCASGWARGRPPLLWHEAMGRIVASLAPTLCSRRLGPNGRRDSGEEIDAAFLLTREIFSEPSAVAGARPLLAYGLPCLEPGKAEPAWRDRDLLPTRIISDVTLFQVLSARLDGQRTDVVVAARTLARLICAHQRHWPPLFTRSLLRELVSRLGKVGVGLPGAWRQALIAACFKRSTLSAALGPPVLPSNERLESLQVVQALEPAPRPDPEPRTYPEARERELTALCVQVEYDAFDAALEALIEEVPLPAYADKLNAYRVPARAQVAAIAAAWERLAHAVNLPAVKRAQRLPVAATLAALARSQPVRWAVLLLLGYWPEHAAAPMLAEGKARFAMRRVERGSTDAIFRLCPQLLEAWTRAVEATGPPVDTLEVQAYIDERATLRREVLFNRSMGQFARSQVRRSPMGGTATP